MTEACTFSVPLLVGCAMGHLQQNCENESETHIFFRNPPVLPSLYHKALQACVTFHSCLSATEQNRQNALLSARKHSSLLPLTKWPQMPKNPLEPDVFAKLIWNFPSLCLNPSGRCDRCIIPCQAPKRSCREQLTSMQCCSRDVVTHAVLPCCTERKRLFSK